MQAIWLADIGLVHPVGADRAASGPERGIVIQTLAACISNIWQTQTGAASARWISQSSYQPPWAEASRADRGRF